MTNPRVLVAPFGSLTDVVVQALGRAQIGVSIASPDGQLVFFTDRLAHMFGYTREELAGRSAFSYLAPDELPRVSELAVRLFGGDIDAVELETVAIRKDGSRMPLEVGAAAFPHDGGQLVIAFLRDISERHRMQDRLALADRMATVGTVAAGIAHEVNNPLTYVLLHLDRIERAAARAVDDPGAVEQIRHAVSQARDGARRVRDIAADLKYLSRPTEDAERPVAVNDVVRSAVRLVAPELRDRARLVEELEDVPQVLANEGRLGQVVLNLLVNAAHAIPPGDRDANEVRVCTRGDGRGVMLEVRDTGAGMPPEVMRRVFDPFYTTKQAGVGTGLGLSICHSIITGMGGEIEVESKLGVGSVFRVRIPTGPGDGEAR